MERRTERNARRIVILGGGFAGLAAALRLDRRHRVTLVDRSRHFEFLPNIHELLSGVKTPQLLRLPRDRIVRRAGHRFVQARIEGIDLESRRVHVTNRRPIGYDALIVGLGGENATYGIPGVVEHALPFKSVEDCHRIGRRLAALRRSRDGGDVVIVGGGLEGVEALGEILRGHAGDGALRVHLVEARDRLVAEAPVRVDRSLRRLAAEHDVELHLGRAVTRVEAGGLTLEGGERIDSRLTIWTGGPAPSSLLAESGLASGPDAWAPINGQLQSHAAENVFVVGDAAELEHPIAKQAYHALDMGEVAANNAVRLLAGRRLRTYRPSPKPMLISFGDVGGFLVAGPLVVEGAAIGAAKEAVYELVMAQLDRRDGPEALQAAFSRGIGAVRELVWPVLRAPLRWPRLARLSVGA